MNKQTENTPNSPATPDNLPAPSQLKPAPEPSVTSTAAPTSIGVLGTVNMLTDAEFIDFARCESVVEAGWQGFVDVGLALDEIRDKRLYRMDYDNFEGYCRDKWEYGRIYVHQLISAAQLFRHLFANCKHRKPDHESQVRPLVGLPLEQAEAAWERAAQKADSGRITARLVKTAMQELQLAPATPRPVSKIARQTKVQLRGLIDSAISELLVLVSQKVSHDQLTPKLEALHGHSQQLFAS